MTTDEIKGLAHLARIAVTEEEVAEYAHDFESILGYVAQINELDIADIDVPQLQVNIAREDANATPAETFSGVMITGAPASEKGFYKVPKIL
jgi:aspartyl-tRNA(Asn)/glutamyl-tRNA(Gln) amidotransferase subunit C